MLSSPDTGSRSGLLRARRVMSLAPGVEGDALWWQDGTIRAVGSASELERRVPSRVPRFDRPGALITPGFVDSHTHFAQWAVGRRRVHLTGAQTLAEALRRASTGALEDGWLLGHGWQAGRWEQQPDRWALDGVTAGPACLESLDLHALWVNSSALAAAGIARDTPDPAGGRIVRDGNGEPNGILLERATELVRAVLPSPAMDTVVGAILAGQAEAHRLGLTGIHAPEGPQALAAFRSLEADDRLRLRVLFYAQVAEMPELLAHGVRSGEGTEWLALGGVKLFLDGSLGSRTAWMLEPYEGGTDRGLPLAPEADARRVIEAAAGAGLACAVHAIGDAAVRSALDLLAGAPATPLPHRIEHLQCVHPDDLTRAAEHGLVASMQPAHLPGDVALAEERWGRRSRGAYPFRRLLEAGTVLAFGSDVPVAPLDPRRGVVAAMARQDAEGVHRDGWYPDERLGFEDVVRAYTVGPAVAAGQASRRGRVAPGFDADLVAWDVDPDVLQDRWDAFQEARASLTVVDGEVVATGEGGRTSG